MPAFPFVAEERFGISLGAACEVALENLGFCAIGAGTTFHTDKRTAFRVATFLAQCAGIAKQRMKIARAGFEREQALASYQEKTRHLLQCCGISFRESA